MGRLKAMLALGGVLFLAVLSARAEDGGYTRKPDVIYGRKAGLALTMDIFTPKKANGRGVIFVVSGGWFSNPRGIRPLYFTELLRRGYTVFAVVHGSQPKFTIPEILKDMHRAVRFIRYHAGDYRIDSERLGIFGASAGGHLSLMQGTAGTKGNPDADDPVERVSSRVQAVAAFFPPTDFLNYGAKGNEMINRSFRPPFTAAQDFHEYDRKKALYVPITDEKKLREISRRISPITHVSADDPPTLLIHGDKDKLVPLQQSEAILARFKEVGVPVRLIVKKGAGHGWTTILFDTASVADWFDRYLALPKTAERPDKAPASPGK